MSASYDYEDGLRDHCVDDPLWAADEIDRLRAEIARLTTENGMLRQDLAETRDLYDQWRQHCNTKESPC